jgi:hypothetical protein
VEGLADAAPSFMKLNAGWFSDQQGSRKGLIVGGYIATGLASGIIAPAVGWPLILFRRFFGWIGRGLRGPLRDALQTDSIPAETRGRAFNFHRFRDTLSAILGLLTVELLTALSVLRRLPSHPLHRSLIAWTLVSGVLSGLAFAWLVRELTQTHPKCRFSRHALSQMPKPFRGPPVRRWGFPDGTLAHALLILAAIQLLTTAFGFATFATLGEPLFAVHNVVYALVTRCSNG